MNNASYVAGSRPSLPPRALPLAALYLIVKGFSSTSAPRQGLDTLLPLIPPCMVFEKKSSSTTPTNRPPMPTGFIKREVVEAHSETKNPGVLAVSSGSIALSICSSSYGPSSVGNDDPESSKESGWRTACGAARMAVEVAEESSDMFPPLKAVVGAVAVLIKNYDVRCPQVSRHIDH